MPSCNPAKVAPNKIRWQMASNFSPNSDGEAACGLIWYQARLHLQRNGVNNPRCVVNFPGGMGWGHFVDVSVAPEHINVLKDAPLVYKQVRLDQLFISVALPHTHTVLEVTSIPANLSLKETVICIVLSLLAVPLLPGRCTNLRMRTFAKDLMAPCFSGSLVVLLTSVKPAISPITWTRH